MPRLPYSVIANVTLTRTTQFPTIRGFGIPLFITSDTVADVLDSSNLTASFSSMQEVSDAGFTSSDNAYKAALQAFSQNPSPISIKFGWYNSATVTDAATLQTALDAILAADNDWYWMVPETDLRDSATLDGLVAWVEGQNKFAIIDSNDSQIEAVESLSIAGRHKNTVERTAVFYYKQTTGQADQYPAFALAALLSTFNFDEPESAYTANFKKLRGYTPLDISSGVLKAITGFVPAQGHDVAQGNNAITYVDIGGINFTQNGQTLTSNVFIDEIHASDWIVSRTEEALLGILANNPRIPYTDAGMQTLASAPREVMRRADIAGLLAPNVNYEDGKYLPNVIINVPSIFSISEAQRKARIAPAITVNFRYAGAVHYVTVHYTMRF